MSGLFYAGQNAYFIDAAILACISTDCAVAEGIRAEFDRSLSDPATS
jgi:hypothetical protein